MYTLFWKFVNLAIGVFMYSSISFMIDPVLSLAMCQYETFETAQFFNCVCYQGI
jgi:hypothetical protein